MPQSSGIDAAIQELQRDVKRVQEAIAMLRRIQNARAAGGQRGLGGRRRRTLSAAARRRISEAAKKRWAARRAGRGAGKASKS
jgi:hypothetical protein